jgi:aspartyl/glutamyl-tRNA(Asn/Gln) amidotransferase, C subunit
MKVSKDDVYYVAALSRLKLDEEDCSSLQDDLNSILIHFEMLSEIDTEGVIPTANIMQFKNRFREDVVKPSLSRDKALENASSVMDGCFKVPKIIE